MTAAPSVQQTAGYFINLKAQSEPAGGIEAIRSSPENSEYTPPTPADTATYCSPSCSHVIGWLSMPDPVLNDHSFLPLSASNPSNSPVNCPENTTPPPVDSTPENRGRSLGASHLALPVIGSTAFRKPRGPSGQAQPRVRSMPRYHSPSL